MRMRVGICGRPGIYHVRLNRIQNRLAPQAIFKLCNMKTVYIFKTIFLLLLQLSQGRSWWLFSGKDEHPETDVSSDSQQQERRPAALPFEISSVEQKFLAEAQQYLDLSPLEQCQHKVILNSLHSRDTRVTLRYPGCRVYR